ncbi:hypothetical protein ACNQFN_06335 [Thauera butanivorans]|uniref:hypothetical protein n=1 Tax=Thauera butanivorans TaxID=86174 RepID=UPI003AB7FEF3
MSSLQDVDTGHEQREVLVFREARLHWGDGLADLVWFNGETVVLQEQPVCFLTPAQHGLIHNHLS